MDRSLDAKTRIIRELFQEALGKAPFPYQEAILTHPGPLVISKARQTGISTAMAALAVWSAALGNRKVLICSNKEENAKHLLQYAWDFIHPLVDSGIVKAPSTDQAGFIRWEAGGEIRCQAASRDAGRGYPVDLAIMDELAHFTKEIDLDRQMLMSVRGTLAQTGGRLILLSTPNGTKNEFYKAFDAAGEKNRMTIHWSQCPTLKIREEILPFGKQYWVGDAPTPMPEMDFRQEFGNDFYVGSDEAIPLEALRAALTSADYSPSADGSTTYYVGADIGYTHDATAYAVVARVPPAGGESAEALWIAEIRILTRVPFQEQVAVLNELVARYKPTRLVMDRTFNPQSTEQALADHPYITEPFVFGDQSKRDLLSKAGSFFTASQVKCPLRNRQVIDEIANIKKVISPAGNIQFKDNPHGDIGWACLLAFWGVPTNPQRTSAAGVWPCEACKGEEPAKTRCGRCGGTGVHVFQF